MPPSLPDVGRIMIEHASKLVDWYGDSAQVRQFRKHAIWYVTGFPVGGARRARLAQIDSIAELESIVADFPAAEFPAEALRVKRSHTGGPKRVVLPDGWLDDIDDETPLPAEAGEHNSGG